MSVPIFCTVAEDLRTKEQKEAMYQAVADMEPADRARLNTVIIPLLRNTDRAVTDLKTHNHEMLLRLDEEVKQYLSTLQLSELARYLSSKLNGDLKGLADKKSQFLYGKMLGLYLSFYRMCARTQSMSTEGMPKQAKRYLDELFKQTNESYVAYLKSFSETAEKQLQANITNSIERTNQTVVDLVNVIILNLDTMLSVIAKACNISIPTPSVSVGSHTIYVWLPEKKTIQLDPTLIQKLVYEYVYMVLTDTAVPVIKDNPYLARWLNDMKDCIYVNWHEQENYQKGRESVFIDSVTDLLGEIERLI